MDRKDDYHHGGHAVSEAYPMDTYGETNSYDYEKQEPFHPTVGLNQRGEPTTAVLTDMDRTYRRLHAFRDGRARNVRQNRRNQEAPGGRCCNVENANSRAWPGSRRCQAQAQAAPHGYDCARWNYRNR